MAVKPIVTIPDKVLTTKCEKITEFGVETKQLEKDLVETVLAAKDPEGAGLAAPQIGILKRACVVRRFIEPKNPEEQPTSKEYVIFNPVITKFSTEKRLGWEGCLSIPDTYVKVERAQKIKVEAFDAEGEKININASGFFARVLQHEIDHLDGILMTAENRAASKTITEKELEKLNTENI